MKLRQSRNDLAVRPDSGRDAVVRGTHQVAPGLERAHAGNLQMLMRRRGISIPRIVGDVDQERRVAQYIELVAAEGVLVANREAELETGAAQYGLMLAPR